MPGVDWRFPAILIIAMLLGLGMSYLQMRAYNAQLNRALKVAEGEHLMLVSGRGRSMRGGAIVIAIANTVTREITWVRAMTGATTFARFRDVPALLGPIEDATDRIKGKQFKAAVTMAMQQVGSDQSTADEAPTTAGETPRLVRRRVVPTTRNTAATGATSPRLQEASERKN